MDSSCSLRGVLVALPTPFVQGKDRIDEDAVHDHVEALLAAGVHGLVVGGSTGEFTTLTMQERKRLTELAVESAAGRAPVIAGVGALALPDALELAAHAATKGAAALLVVPPFYDALKVGQLESFLLQIHTISGLPLMFYHIPSVSGTSLTPGQLASLADSGVRYIKYTADDAGGLSDMLLAHEAEITTFVGNDTLMFHGLAAGAQGIVWGLASIIPEIAVLFWNVLAVERDLEGARQLWARIWPICKFFESNHYAAAVKMAMELVGRPTGFSYCSRLHKELKKGIVLR
jgi:dihydrodipicolinate synthase/N-acetylneuraminate lyase